MLESEPPMSTTFAPVQTLVIPARGLAAPAGTELGSVRQAVVASDGCGLGDGSKMAPEATALSEESSVPQMRAWLPVHASEECVIEIPPVGALLALALEETHESESGL